MATVEEITSTGAPRSKGVTSSPVGTVISGMEPVLQGASDGNGTVQSIRLFQPADASGSVGLLGVLSYAVQMLFNGTSFDRQRNNHAEVPIASASRTATTAAAVTVYNERYLEVIINVTVPGTGSVTVNINGSDPASGAAYLLLASAAVTTAGTVVLRIGPGLPDVANASANRALPRTLQIQVVHNNANAITYSVGYNLSV